MCINNDILVQLCDSYFIHGSDVHWFKFKIYILNLKINKHTIRIQYMQIAA